MEKPLKIFITAFFILSLSSLLYAQESNNCSPKFTCELGLGKSFLSGIRNISPWGIHYRGNYSEGNSVNTQVNYIFKDHSFWGLKIEIFAAAGNYEIDSDQRVAENINTYYFAPQVGSLHSLTPHVSFLYNAGVGYVRYQNRGLLEETEYNIHSDMLGVNADVSFDYLITKSAAIGCKASAFIAFLGKQKRDIGGEKSVITMDKWNNIDPSKFDFSIFYRIYF